ncbi:cytochrome P450 2U1-like [Asterias amurensis]|uniref:cytochrome P450 2U1-like n=1 Tax=Asterias amurensis TaxID=7602 RepID=UPI003AB55495
MLNQIVDLLQMVGWQTAILFLVVFFVGLYWIQQPVNLPPGPTGWPVVGCAFNVQKGKTHIAFTEWSKQYGDVISVRLGRKLFIVLNDLRSIKKALHEQADVFSDRFVPHFTKLMGVKGSFLFEDGPIWKERRRFGLGALRTFGMGKKSIEHSINEESRYLLDVFADRKGKPFDPAHLVNNAVSNIICKVCFGYRFDYSDPKFAELIGRLREQLSQNGPTSAFNIFEWVLHTPLMNRSIGNARKTFDFVRGIIQDHHKSYDENDIRDIIDMGIAEVRQSESKEKHDDGRNFTDIFNDGALCRSIVDLFIAGTDTTTNTLLWTLMYMALHPDMQKKVQSEIDDVTGGSRQPLMADSPNMPYTNAVILETQRIRPVAPLAVPHKTRDDTTLDGYTIPKKTCILVNIWAVHHDPATWTEPEKYKPARFLSADGKSVIQHKSLIPFGTGRRACLGENLAKSELLLFLVNVLQQFTVTFPEGKPIPSEDGSAGFVLSSRPYELCATRRS